jgi:cell division protein FtsN
MARPGAGRRHATAKKRVPGWVWLLLGLTLGVATVLMAQLVLNRSGSKDGIAGLFTRTAKPAVAPPVKAEPAPARPEFDFYTVLPEVETVLPERSARGGVAKTDRTDDGALYVLQAGAFARFEDADQLKAKLALQGLQAQIQRVTIEGRGDFHRVRLGPYDRIDDLDNAAQQLTKMGLKGMRLKLKKRTG